MSANDDWAPCVMNRRTRSSGPTLSKRLDVYIGRGSKWGNPFVIGKDGNRRDVCEKYERWLATQPRLIEALDELAGKHLVCYCAPERCHGDLLLKLANDKRLRGEWLRTVSQLSAT